MTVTAWLIRLLGLAYRVYSLLLLVRVLLSWFPGNRGPAYYRWFRVLRRLTDPVLRPVRRYLPPFGGLDLSPLVALMLLGIVHWLLVTLVLAAPLP